MKIVLDVRVVKVSGRKLTLNFHHMLNVWEAMLPVENDYATYMTFDKIEG